MQGRSLFDCESARHLRHVINEKRETGIHLWIPERDRWYDIMQMSRTRERDGDAPEVQHRQVSSDKIYTRMKRFITKAFSTYSEINYAKFCFHFVPLWGFSLSCRISAVFVFIARDSEVDIYDKFAVCRNAFWFLWDIGRTRDASRRRLISTWSSGVDIKTTLLKGLLLIVLWTTGSWEISRESAKLGEVYVMFRAWYLPTTSFGVGYAWNLSGTFQLGAYNFSRGTNNIKQTIT